MLQIGVCWSRPHLIIWVQLSWFLPRRSVRLDIIGELVCQNVVRNGRIITNSVISCFLVVIIKMLIKRSLRFLPSDFLDSFSCRWYLWVKQNFFCVEMVLHAVVKLSFRHRFTLGDTDRIHGLPQRPSFFYRLFDLIRMKRTNDSLFWLMCNQSAQVSLAFTSCNSYGSCEFIE